MHAHARTHARVRARARAHTHTHVQAIPTSGAVGVDYAALASVAGPGGDEPVRLLALAQTGPGRPETSLHRLVAQRRLLRPASVNYSDSVLDGGPDDYSAHSSDWYLFDHTFDQLFDRQRLVHTQKVKRPDDAHDHCLTTCLTTSRTTRIRGSPPRGGQLRSFDHQRSHTPLVVTLTQSCRVRV